MQSGCPLARAARIAAYAIGAYVTLVLLLASLIAALVWMSQFLEWA